MPYDEQSHEVRAPANPSCQGSIERYACGYHIGAKAESGKTTLAKEIEPERTLVTMDANDAFVAVRDQPDDFIDALPARVIIDEIQKVPALLPAIKRSVDFNRKAGRFLLTSSANLLMLPKVTESLAGRMEIVHLQPLCEAEKSNSIEKFLRGFLMVN